MSDVEAPDPEEFVVVHPVGVLATPAFGAPVVTLLGAGDQVVASKYHDGFLAVECPEGPSGFIPAAVCAPLALGSSTASATIQVAQPVSLYCHPMPGKQFAANAGIEERAWLIVPEEHLTLLGYDSGFVLVQRDNAFLGYVPTSVCHPHDLPHGIARRSRFDLGALLLGGALFIPNWLGLIRTFQEAQYFGVVAPQYLSLAVMLCVVGLLWRYGSPRTEARSFAIGVLIAYAIIRAFV